MTLNVAKALLADDHPLVRDGIRYLFGTGSEGTEILEAGTWSKTFQLIKEHQDLDLILLDLTMPGMEGLSAVKKARASIPTAPIVILSMSDDLGQIEACLRLGVNGYIPKSSSTELMLSAIEVVLNGGIYVPPHLLASLQEGNKLGQTRESNQRTGLDNAVITNRQQEVLRLIALGKTNKEIAHTLSISDTTVKSHITSIFRQLSANNRTEAVHRGNQLGLLGKQPAD